MTMSTINQYEYLSQVTMPGINKNKTKLLGSFHKRFNCEHPDVVTTEDTTVVEDAPEDANDYQVVETLDKSCTLGA
jgi:hypothetical protein